MNQNKTVMQVWGGYLLFFITLVFILFVGSVSSAAIFLILFIAGQFHFKDERKLFVLLFPIGILFAIFLYHYWMSITGNSYYLGAKSDDWQYDVLWSKDYYKLYGISYNELQEYLGGYHNSYGYVYLIILLRWFGDLFDGYHTLLPRMLNIYLLFWISSIASRIVRFYLPNKPEFGLIAATAIFLYPVMIFNSSHVFRDTLISLLILRVFHYSRIKGISIKSVFYIIICLSILISLRVGTLFFVVFMMGIIFIQKKHLKISLALLGLVFVGLGVFYFDFFMNYVTSKLSSYSELNSERLGTFGSKVFGLPIFLGFIPRIIYFIFTPVPNFSGFHQLFVSISAFLQIFFFPILLGSVFSRFIDKRLIFSFLIFFLGVALSTATFRHVMMYIPFGIILVTIYIGINGFKISRDYIGKIIGLFICFVLTLLVAIIF
jgi:hypothetical protein